MWHMGAEGTKGQYDGLCDIWVGSVQFSSSSPVKQSTRLSLGMGKISRRTLNVCLVPCGVMQVAYSLQAAV